MIKLKDPTRPDRRQSPPTRMATSVRNLFGDAMTLAELQLQLFKADLKDSRTHMVRGAILLTIGAVLLLASLPVVMIAGGYALVEQFNFPMWAGFLISSGIGLIIAALTLWVASRWLVRSVGFFKRSTEELSNNVRWMKSVAADTENQTS